MRGLASCAALLLAFCAAGPAAAEGFELKSLRTREMVLLYPAEQAYLAPYAARTFLNSLEFQKRVLGWTPDGEIVVILTDFSDYNNGGASATPVNGVVVQIAPDSHTLETTPGNERMFMLANHELVHVATMDAATKQDMGWRRLFFGKPRQTDAHPETILYNYLTVPRLTAPRWYLEGSASFLETWMSGGFGRAQGAYDEMVFRSMVRDGTRFYDPLGLVSAGTAADFQTMTNAYLYGTRFITYLSFKESPQKVIAWFRRDEGSKRYYSDQFQHVFGKPLEQAWQEWIAWEQSFQKANLAQVRQHPLTQARRLVPHGLGSVSKSYVDKAGNALVGGIYYPGVLPHVGSVSLADGSVRRLADIKGPMKYRVTSTAFDAATRTLFYTEDNLALRDLFAIDVGTGQRRELIKDARIGDLAFNPQDKSLWGLRHENGYVALVRLPPPYTDFNLVHQFAYGTVPFDLDVSPDGKLLSASVGEIDGKQFLRLYRMEDLLRKEVKAIHEVDFGQAIPEGFVFSPDGRYLYGSAYYTGISNIFRYEIGKEGFEAVSNAETGFFRPIPREDGTLVVLEHTGQGFVPAVIRPDVVKDLGTISFLGNEVARAHPVVLDWGAGSPDRIDLQKETVSEAPYRPGNEMRLLGAYPVVEGYRNTAGVGYHFDFGDPMSIDSLGVTVSASPQPQSAQRERLHVDVDYKTLEWRLRYWHNHASFYDLFGPTKRSLAGDAVLVGYRRPLIIDDPRRLDFTFDVARYTGLKTLPGDQNVQASSSTLTNVRAAWKYTNTYRSANAVDHESGMRWNVVLGASRAGEDTPVSARAGFDFGFALPLPHSSVWLYSSAGRITGPRSNSQANYYFGGFQNNIVDDGEAKRYREYQTFPGYEIDAIAGQTFVKGLLELNLPPVRFENVGTAGFYLGWMRPAVFAGVLRTDPGRPQAMHAKTLGGQLDFNVSVMHRLPMTLSVGYARGRPNARSNGEWMVSLKILGQ